MGGVYTWRAHYLGDDTYLPSDSGCAPAIVLDANIQISPLAATNTVGTPHTLTVHVNVNENAQDFTNAHDGTLVNVSLTNAGGANAGFGSADGPTTTTCTTGSPPSAPESGDCQVTIVSSTVGTTTVHASVDVNVGGPFDLLIAHRATGDGHPGDSPDATKRWARGPEACPQGFWKNNPQAWGPSGFSPDQTLGSVFSGTGIPGTTLIAALRLKGGNTVQDAKNLLLRAAVTALLNAGDPRVTSPQALAPLSRWWTRRWLRTTGRRSSRSRLKWTRRTTLLARSTDRRANHSVNRGAPTGAPPAFTLGRGSPFRIASHINRR